MAAGAAGRGRRLLSVHCTSCWHTSVPLGALPAPLALYLNSVLLPAWQTPSPVAYLRSSVLP